MNWSLVKLSDICEINIGKTPARANSDYWGKGYPWLSIADMNQGREIFYTKEEITELAVKETNIKLVPKGTVLFSFKLSIGKIGIAQRDIYTNEAIAALPIKDHKVLCESYLVYALTKMDALKTTDRAVMGATLNKKKLSELKIPLPSLAEQKEIADVLDKADALCQKREKAIALTDDLLSSLFLDMFGDPVTNPNGWECVSFSECVKAITGGWSVSGMARPAQESEFGVLKISAVTSGYFIASENKAVESVPQNKKLVIPKRGDLLFSRANTRELVAAMCIVDHDAGNLFLPDKIWRIDLQEDQATNEYIKFLFAHPEFRNRLCKKATGTSGSMLNISKAKLMAHEVPLPPLSLQKKFSAFYHKLQTQKEKYKTAYDLQNHLFSALTQSSFSDELTSQKEAA